MNNLTLKILYERNQVSILCFIQFEYIKLKF